MTERVKSIVKRWRYSVQPNAADNAIPMAGFPPLDFRRLTVSALVVKPRWPNIDFAEICLQGRDG